MNSARSRARRPLKTRRRRPAVALARRLAARGVDPNQISSASLVFAAGAGAFFLALPHVSAPAQVALLVGAALCIQLRLLANMLDGMVAVEGGRGSALGDLFNEVPDRVADLVVLVTAGYAVTWISWGDALGWAAGASAILTAYVRLLGGALGVSQHFTGPLAKPQRMALLTAACLASLLEVAYGFSGRVLAVALGIVVAGSLVTCGRRLRLVAGELRAR